MTLSLGVALEDFDWSGYTDTPSSLAALDYWKNQLADKLSLGHDNASSAQLYPATCAVWENIVNINSPNAAPAGAQFPDFALLTGLAQRGVTPLVYLQMTGSGWPGAWTGNLAGWDPSVSTWLNWTNGVYDWFLDEWSTSARQWAASLSGVTSQGNPVSCELIVRLCQEMNANWFPWRTTDSGHTNNTPAKFIAAWKHIHDRVRIVNGASHVKLNYCPWPTTGGSDTSITANYAGDAWCQYAGSDIYSSVFNASDTIAQCPSLRSALNSSYTELTGISALPIILGEAGITQANVVPTPDVPFADADRAAWFTGSGWNGAGSAGGYPWVAANDPQLRNITYFDIGQWLFNNASWPLTIGAYAAQANTYTARMPGANLRDVALPGRALPIFS